MCEIKFRAWDDDKKCMFIPKNIELTSDGAVRIYYNQHGHYNSRMELMQFTGIKDKNGKEIYENDKVRVYKGKYSSVGVVIWSNAGWWIRYKNRAMELYIDADDMGVIGNIHENPELLTKEREQ